jgi:hypothetical protein
MTAQLSLYQSLNLFPIGSSAPGSSTFSVYAPCDGIILTVYIASIASGATLTINVTEQVIDGESFSLGGTGALSAVGSKRFAIKGFLNTPIFTATVSGGSVTFGATIAGKNNIPGGKGTTDFDNMGHEFTVSTSAPFGGSDGDIWVRI